MAKSELPGDHDVVMLKSIQRELEQSKQMLQLVLDTVPVRVFWKDIDLRFLGCNLPFAMDAGLSDPSDLLGKTDYDMGWRKQATQYRADDMLVIESGEPKLNYEEPQTTPQGKTIWLKTSKIPLKNEQGEVIGVLGTYEDITESKRSALIQEAIYGIAGATVSSGSMESLIADIRAQMSVLVETPNFYIALYDESNDMLSIPYEEDEKDEIFSWPAKRSVTGLVIKNKKSLLLRKKDVQQLLEEDVIDLIGTSSEIWLGVPLFQGEKVIGAIAMQSYNNPDAFDESTVGILEFISGQVSMAIQRKRMFDELVMAKEKAEEGDRLKTAFLNNLSHEIRTPLNAIVGFSQFLNEPDLDAERISHITGVICRSSDQLLSIISDIISISTIEAGILEVNPRRININNVLKNVYDLLLIKAAGKGLELHYRSSIREEDAAVIADETKLVQIISNLVDNAIKFTHKGVVEFGCSLKENMIRFFVNDTGIGIVEALHPVIFERFHQVDAGNSSNMGGLGLGLPIAKSFVERMGGKIWLESSPGHGTRFTFSIPYQPANTPAKKEVLPDPISQKTKGTILVAEDEENNFELTKTILAMLGIEVLHAWDGEQAVNMCEQHPDIDMVLMDIKMPVMNGYEATMLIKEQRPGLPVVALTAYALIGDREKALNAGCDDYLAKPVSLADFQKMVQKHLK